MNGRAKHELALRVAVVPLHRAEGFAAIALERLDRPGVMVEMRDTGTGMPPDVQEQIFEPFYTTKAAGTGLGLAIVQRIVQSHDGAITVESQQNEGTTFRVWLPTDRAIGAGFSSGQRPAIP
jgi:signal transduction histidine kinase